MKHFVSHYLPEILLLGLWFAAALWLASRMLSAI